MIANKLEYHIDSKLRETNSESDSDFYYKLDIPSNIIDKLTHVSVTYFTCPKSAYVIEESDNRNKFQIWKNGVGYIDIELTEGNYVNTNIYGDTYDIKKQLKTKLDEATGNTWTISKYLHPYTETGKLLFTCDDATNKKFVFNTYNNNIRDIMGFNDILTESEIFTNSIISTTITNLNKNNVIYLTSDICMHENKDRALGGHSILDCIYLSQNKLLSFVTSQYDLIFNMKDFSKKKNGIYHFKIYNEDGRNMILNNVSLSFTICLFTYIDVSKLLKKISDYIDFRSINL